MHPSRHRPARRRWPRLVLAALLAVLVPGEAGEPTEIEALRARAQHGDARALNALGEAYAAGRGVTENHPEALSYFQQAAERGLAAAWFNLGVAHELGRGVAQDIAKAFSLYLKAAERGSELAQFNVGNMYANGVGVPQDHLEAVLWFRRAAASRLPEAQFNLGLAYELGRGVRKDEVLAQRWYRLAAASGNAQAQHNLAVMLEQGRGSVADLTGALNLYRAAAARGFGPAQNNLGIMLAEGRGGAANPVEAFVWLTLAKENGVDSGVRDVVARQLSPDSVAEAGRVVAQLRSGVPAQEVRLASQATAEPRLPAPLAAPEPATVRIEQAAPDELLNLRAQLVTAEAALRDARSENSRLAELLRVAEQDRADLEARLRVAERTAAQFERVPPVDDKRQAHGLLTVHRAQAAETRVEELARENARLAGEVDRLRANLGLLADRLRMAEPKPEPASPVAYVESGADVALLNRRIEVLKSTVDKLAAESRWHAGIRAELSRLKNENETLRRQQGGSN